jgi:uncharacterized DUF497 family protein
MSPVVIVMGASGSGKSTLAAALPRELDFSFLEGDSFHSEENKRKMSAGIALEDADRWPWLDALSAAPALGRTIDGRRLHITFTLRGDGKLIRVISARDMHRKERAHYEQATQDNT